MKKRMSFGVVAGFVIAVQALPALGGFFSATNFPSGAMNDANVGLSTNHQYVIAANLTGTNVTINGVTFSGTGLSSNYVGFSLSGANNQITSGGNKGNVAGQLTNLFNQFQYGGNPALVFLSNLVAGASYEVTFYNQSWTSPGSRTQTVAGSSGGSIVVNQDPGGGSLWRYVFAATGATETITFTPVIAGNTFHFYGFSERQIFNNQWNIIGNGSFNEPANWTRLDAGASIGTPNGMSLSALFADTQTGPATIMLDSNVAPGHLSFAGANTYTLASTNGSVLTMQADAGEVSAVSVASGTHVLNVPVVSLSDFVKLGAGTLVVSNSIGGAGRTVAAGGLLELAAANIITGTLAMSEGGRASIDGFYPLAPSASLQFVGGLLRVTGTNVTGIGGRNVNWTNFHGGFDIADAANTLIVSNDIGTTSTAGNFIRYGAGALVVTNSKITKQIILFHQGSNFIESGSVVTAQNYMSIAQLPAMNASMIVHGNGRLVSQGDFNVGDLSGSTGILTIADSAAVAARTLYIGKFGSAVGIMNLTGGSFTPNAGAGDWRIGGGGSTNDRNAYGYVRQTGGSFMYIGNFQIGGYGLAQWDLIGGGLTNGTGAPIVGRYPGSRANMNVLGGQWVSPNWGTIIGEQGHGVLNVMTGFVNLTGAPVGQALTMGGWQAASEQGTGIVNLAAGGSIATPAVRKGATNASVAIFHFDGGLLRASAANGTFMQGLDLATVWPGGANFDSQTFNITVAQPLVAPAGDGVASITITNSGAGYIGPPVVTIIGGGGTGATAYAQIDSAAGTVTNIIITSPGVNYAPSPTVLLQGGGGSGAGATASLAANVTGGGLTKSGVGTLTLTAANTYGGNTIIGNGTILVGNTNALGGGTVTLMTNTVGIGTTYAMDQDFLNWLTTRLDIASSPGVLALGASDTNTLDLAAFTNWSFGAANGSFTFGGSLLNVGTNLFLGGGNGTLTYVPTIGTGTNVFIGQAGGNAGGVVILSGTNDSYSSTIEIRSGTLRAGRANAFGGTSAVVNVGSGTVLDINGQSLGAVPVNVIGSGIGGAGAIINSGAQQINALQKVTLTGDATFGGANRWDLRGGPPSLDLAGFWLTKTGASYIAVVGGNISDGNIVIGQGIFSIEAGAVVTGGVGTITVQQSGTLNLWSGPSPVILRPITVNGGTISCSSGTNFIGAPITLAGATNTFNSGGFILVLTGLVNGSGTLLKTGGGTLMLPNPAAYTGATIVSGGVLELSSSDPLAGTIGTSGSLIINGGRVLVDYNRGIFGTNLNPIAITAGGVLATSNGVSCTIDGPLSLSGGSLAGNSPNETNGNWILNVSVAVTTNSMLSAPRIQLGKADGVAFDVAASGLLSVSSTFEDPGLGLGGTGTLIKAGAGTITLSATNSYGGPTIVSNGLMKLGGSIPPGVIARYTFDGDVNDASGNGFNGTINGAGTSYVPGRFGQALSFTGAQNVQIPYYAAFSQNTYTVSAWFNIVSNATTYGIFGTRVGGDTTIDFKIQPGKIHGDIGNGTAWITTGADASTVIPLNSWHMVTYVVTSTGYTIYLDGSQIGAGGYSATPLLMKSGQTMLIGDCNGSEKMIGGIDDVNIYGRALSPGEIVALYTLNAGGATNLLPQTTPLWLASTASLDLNSCNQSIGPLTGSGLIVNNGASQANLAVGSGNSSGTFSGVIANGTGTVALVKIGSGTQTLNGLNTFTGPTDLSNGTLIVNGSIGTGQVNIAAGATLGGTGVVGGSVFDIGGIVAPGTSPGTLTVLGDYASYGSLDIEIAGATLHDKLVVGGGADISGATLNVTTNGYAPVVGDSFTILTASNGITGPFAIENLPALGGGSGWLVTYQPAAVVLSVTGAPATAGYDLWAGAITNGQTNYNQSASGDGYPNLLKYATGSNPNNSDNVAQMNRTTTNGMFALKFNRNTNATDLTLIIEGAYTSTNGAIWNGIATNIHGSWGATTNYSENTSTDPASVVVWDTATATNRFLRLRVTRP